MQVKRIPGLVGVLAVMLQLGAGLSIADTVSDIAYPPDASIVTGSPERSADEPQENNVYLPSLIVDPLVYDEPFDTGWQLYIDNDLFVSPDIDRDYTGGVAIALTGRRAREWWFSIDPWLDILDRFTGVQRLQLSEGGFARHALEFGVTLFTPENITLSEPAFNDRPYASFWFIANSQQAIFPDEGLLLQSSLAIGFLGLNASGEFQSAIHSLTGSESPEGWRNQISNGGELTAKYSVNVQKSLVQKYKKLSFELSAGAEGSLGVATDVSANLAMRIGALHSPWWSFTPHQSDYINLGQTITSRVDERVLPAEIFAWGGIKARYRIYNGFLQGQFRSSAVEFESNQLEDTVYEAWLGVTKTWNNGFGLSFVVRGRTEEIRDPVDRNPIWSGFIVSFKN